MKRQTGVRGLEKGKYGFQKPVTKLHAEQQGCPAEFCCLTLLEQDIPKQSNRLIWISFLSGSA
jgi:hypothetical protein